MKKCRYLIGSAKEWVQQHIPPEMWRSRGMEATCVDCQDILLIEKNQYEAFHEAARLEPENEYIVVCDSCAVKRQEKSESYLVVQMIPTVEERQQVRKFQAEKN